MRRFGLVGYPLTHSFSIKFFNESFFPEKGIDAEYVNFEIPDVRMMLDIVRMNQVIPLIQELQSFLQREKLV